MGELKTVGFIFLCLLLVWLAYRAKKLGYFGNKEKPLVVNQSHAGRYVGQVIPPDNNKWGDGTNPAEPAVLAAHPEWRGLGYRLGGVFELTVETDGKIAGTFTLWGNAVAITSGQIPAGQNAVYFAVAGATGEMQFDSGKVTGRICEPHDCGFKYGNIVGQRV